MFRRFLQIMLMVLAVQLAYGVTKPAPYGPVPSDNQLAWHEMEYYGLVCYGLNTYTGQEWGYGDVSPDVFKPTDLDTDQWARVASAAGMKGLILVAKHHDGFCLWPSRTTDYTIAATSWKNGKGDVLGDLSKSCKKYGLKLGVYVSPWDRNHSEYGRQKYLKDYHDQWREVLSNYGEIFEVWFDGANGGTGYYGGAREKRSIPKDYYQYDKVFKLIKDMQPNVIFFGGVNLDAARWVGNESGYAGTTNWSTFSDTDTTIRKLREGGLKGGKYWMPAEADTTILHPKKWYYNASSKPRTLKQFTDLYYTTVGRNASFNLGLSIGPDGLIPEDDVKAMLAQKKQLDKDFAIDLAKVASITASEFRGNDPAYAAGKCIDSSTKNCWATSDGIQEASLLLTFKKLTAFNRFLLQEYIALGQRVESFTIEVDSDGRWEEIAQGTTIGYKRILRFAPVTTSKVRLTLKTEAPCLTLSNMSIYNAPIIMSDPVVNADRSGIVSINGPAGAQIFFAIGKDVATKDFKKYSEPFVLSKGGHVRAYALDPATNDKSGIIEKEIGVSKANWKIVDCSFANEGSVSVERLIDGDMRTMWHTHGKDGRMPPPQWVVIDLGETVEMEGFLYMPRHDGTAVGLVDRYSIYVSDQNGDWGESIAKGEFSNISNNPIQQRIFFDKSVKGRFVKFVAEHSLDQNDCVAVCELGIIIKEMN